MLMRQQHSCTESGRLFVIEPIYGRSDELLFSRLRMATHNRNSSRLSDSYRWVKDHRRFHHFASRVLAPPIELNSALPRAPGRNTPPCPISCRSQVVQCNVLSYCNRRTINGTENSAWISIRDLQIPAVQPHLVLVASSCSIWENGNLQGQWHRRMGSAMKPRDAWMGVASAPVYSKLLLL